MDVARAVQLRQALELDIASAVAALVYKFEQSTGLPISDLTVMVTDVTTIGDTRRRVVVSDARVTVEL